jgi:hypothetical protein
MTIGLGKSGGLEVEVKKGEAKTESQKAKEAQEFYAMSQEIDHTK